MIKLNSKGEKTKYEVFFHSLKGFPIEGAMVALKFKRGSKINGTLPFTICKSGDIEFKGKSSFVCTMMPGKKDSPVKDKSLSIELILDSSSIKSKTVHLKHVGDLTIGNLSLNLATYFTQSIENPPKNSSSTISSSNPSDRLGTTVIPTPQTHPHLFTISPHKSAHGSDTDSLSPKVATYHLRFNIARALSRPVGSLFSQLGMAATTLCGTLNLSIAVYHERDQPGMMVGPISTGAVRGDEKILLEWIEENERKERERKKERQEREKHRERWKKMREQQASQSQLSSIESDGSKKSLEVSPSASHPRDDKTVPIETKESRDQGDFNSISPNIDNELDTISHTSGTTANDTSFDEFSDHPFDKPTSIRDHQHQFTSKPSPFGLPPRSPSMSALSPHKRSLSHAVFDRMAERGTDRERIGAALSPWSGHGAQSSSRRGSGHSRHKRSITIGGTSELCSLFSHEERERRRDSKDLDLLSLDIPSPSVSLSTPFMSIEKPPKTTHDEAELKDNDTNGHAGGTIPHFSESSSSGTISQSFHRHHPSGMSFSECGDTDTVIESLNIDDDDSVKADQQHDVHDHSDDKGSKSGESKSHPQATPISPHASPSPIPYSSGNSDDHKDGVNIDSATIPGEGSTLKLSNHHDAWSPSISATETPSKHSSSHVNTPKFVQGGSRTVVTEDVDTGAQDEFDPNFSFERRGDSPSKKLTGMETHDMSDQLPALQVQGASSSSPTVSSTIHSASTPDEHHPHTVFEKNYQYEKQDTVVYHEMAAETLVKEQRASTPRQSTSTQRQTHRTRRGASDGRGVDTTSDESCDSVLVHTEQEGLSVLTMMEDLRLQNIQKQQEIIINRHFVSLLSFVQSELETLFEMEDYSYVHSSTSSAVAIIGLLFEVIRQSAHCLKIVEDLHLLDPVSSSSSSSDDLTKEDPRVTKNNKEQKSITPASKSNQPSSRTVQSGKQPIIESDICGSGRSSPSTTLGEGAISTISSSSSATSSTTSGTTGSLPNGASHSSCGQSSALLSLSLTHLLSSLLPSLLSLLIELSESQDVDALSYWGNTCVCVGCFVSSLEKKAGEFERKRRRNRRAHKISGETIPLSTSVPHPGTSTQQATASGTKQATFAAKSTPSGYSQGLPDVCVSNPLSGMLQDILMSFDKAWNSGTQPLSPLVLHLRSEQRIKGAYTTTEEGIRKELKQILGGEIRESARSRRHSARDGRPSTEVHSDRLETVAKTLLPPMAGDLPTSPSETQSSTDIPYVFSMYGSAFSSGSLGVVGERSANSIIELEFKAGLGHPPSTPSPSLDIPSPSFPSVSSLASFLCSLVENSPSSPLHLSSILRRLARALSLLSSLAFSCVSSACESRVSDIIDAGSLLSSVDTTSPGISGHGSGKGKEGKDSGVPTLTMQPSTPALHGSTMGASVTVGNKDGMSTPRVGKGGSNAGSAVIADPAAVAGYLSVTTSPGIGMASPMSNLLSFLSHLFMLLSLENTTSVHIVKWLLVRVLREIDVCVFNGIVLAREAWVKEEKDRKRREKRAKLHSMTPSPSTSHISSTALPPPPPLSGNTALSLKVLIETMVKWCTSVASELDTLQLEQDEALSIALYSDDNLQNTHRALTNPAFLFPFCSQLSNVLLTGKSALLDPQLRSVLCPNLNPVQLDCIVALFEPDHVVPARVSSSVVLQVNMLVAEMGCGAAQVTVQATSEGVDDVMVTSRTLFMGAAIRKGRRWWIE
ncbi:hypothetical protein ADUPG1_000073 [Aduncisulcus paluster]|uniref:C2 NT-type domain-containing protein n=1 Tax=Aduncisulcus paluster TaxID=2918883 RepID=A0ABQ5K4P9_9EUKA|nr:hypothetical protein ADUPG1_000073 [Aduncisulcus paluster]